MLTATPVNNSIHDFRHMVELSGDEASLYEPVGHPQPTCSLQPVGKTPGEQAGRRSRQQLEFGPEIFAAEDALRSDSVFYALVVQRSRAYVKDSQQQQGANEALFPKREAPQVVAYNLKATYGKLLAAVEQAFNKKKPLFVLGMYYPLAYWKGDKADPLLTSFDEGRQKQVVISYPHPVPQALREFRTRL